MAKPGVLSVSLASREGVSKKQKVDKKTEVTFRTMENMRASNAAFQDFIKVATNYQKACLSNLFYIALLLLIICRDE